MKTNRYLSMYLGHDASISIYDGNTKRFYVIDLEKFAGIKHLSMRKGYAEPEIPKHHDPQYWEEKTIEHKDQHGKSLGYNTICWKPNLDYIMCSALKEWSKQNNIEPHFDGLLVKLASSTRAAENFLRAKLPKTLELLRAAPAGLKVKFYGGSTHHRSHAWCGFGQSGFTDAMAIVWDVVGDNEPTTVWQFKNGQLKHQQHEELLATPKSPPKTHWRIMRTFGRVYNNVGTACKSLSNTKELLDIAGKLMGLSAYGERTDMTEYLCKEFDKESLAKLTTFQNNKETRVKDPATGAWMVRLNAPHDEAMEKDQKGEVVTWGIDFKNYAELNWDIAAMLGKPGYKKGKWKPVIEDAELSFHIIDGKQEKDLAWAAQEWLERSLLNLVEEFYHTIMQEYGGNLIISGGCALNVLANARLKREYPNLNIFVPPSPGDNGLSTGMLIEWLVEQGIIDTRHHHSLLHNLSMSGLRMQNRKFYEQKWKKDFREVDINVIKSALKSGKIIGLIQGQCESGPRSLGNRSILCDPSFPNMKNILNKKVKYRESFRPFAPVCRIDDAAKYFDSEHFRNMQFMGYSCFVKEEYREKLSAITHVDGTARLQTVDRFTNPLLYDILTEFDGVLLNTSFNVQGKPILNDYQDAYNILWRSELDHVVIVDDEDGRMYMTKAKGK